MQAIERLSPRPADLPGAALLRHARNAGRVVEAVKASYQQQLPLEGVREPVDVERVVATVCAEVADATIDIPRVLVVPIGRVESGFSPFTLDLSSVHYQPVTEDCGFSTCGRPEYQVLSTGAGGIRERATGELRRPRPRGLRRRVVRRAGGSAVRPGRPGGQPLPHLPDRGRGRQSPAVPSARVVRLDPCADARARALLGEGRGGYEVKVSHGFTSLKPQRVYGRMPATPCRTTASNPQTRPRSARCCSAASRGACIASRSSSRTRNAASR